ncbi:flavin reductase family protein [Corynebacterium halotolerans]|uniref:Flavin reductase domain-containing FMN-binding protein n=1 Tax=Corynebacterium halotolerans YIM 70093 = DSM 44683 TaxID=1121362 RepID=M1NKX1_9CORY|nr:flavin reductase [Corynebacterium halotolerans]AGF72028.1 flavin reductase domain-containing FMN-binding protein [Corynebacterium halotolerans YIM 70093 = DSM 44683]
MSDGAFNSLMASVDSPLVVVTTTAEDEQAGCLVGFHSQSGISPEHYCLWLSKANHTYRVGLRATHFAVHFLAREDLAMAERFGTLSGEDTDKFAGLDVETDETGVPLIRACPNRMVLERIAVLDDGSDHVCVTTRVLSAQARGTFEPLLLSDAAHLDAGHASEERAIQP